MTKGFGAVAYTRLLDRLRKEADEKKRAAELRLQAQAFRATAKVAAGFQAITGRLPSEVNPEGAEYVRARLEDTTLRPSTFLSLRGPLGIHPGIQPPPIPTPQENLEQLGFGGAPVRPRPGRFRR